MRLLAIDPASNVRETSNTGIVLLENTKIVDTWVLDYGVDNFNDWWEKTGQTLDFDATVVENFMIRSQSTFADSSVLDVINAIVAKIPQANLLYNTGYRTEIPDALLQALDLWDFDTKSHHQELRAATRLGLYFYQMNDVYEAIQEIGARIGE